MGILERVRTITAANINALLDKAEDPEKMVDQMIIDAKKGYAEVKDATAKAMAAEVQAKAAVDDIDDQIERKVRAAKNAKEAGDMDAARDRLEQKAKLMSQRESLVEMHEAAKQQAAMMQKQHDEIVAQIQLLEQKRMETISKLNMAKGLEANAKVMEKVGATDALGAFDKYGSEADRRLREAQAKMNLAGAGIDSEKDPYESGTYVSKTAIEEELANL